MDECECEIVQIVFFYGVDLGKWFGVGGLGFVVEGVFDEIGQVIVVGVGGFVVDGGVEEFGGVEFVCVLGGDVGLLGLCGVVVEVVFEKWIWMIVVW